MKRILVVSIFCLITSARADFTNGLIGYYPFNGNANDASGNGNNGTVQGATLTADRFGNPNSAYYFNGTNAYISAVIPNLPAGTAPRTLTGWLMPTKVLGILSAIGYGAGNESGQCGIGFLDLTNLYFWKGDTTWRPQLPITFNTWSFVAVTYSNDLVTLWLNNDNNTWNVALNTGNNGKLFLGAASVDGQTPSVPYAYPTNFPIWFEGAIDDVRVYDRALTTQDIQQLYLAESGPLVQFVKAFTLDYSGLFVGSNYQLQASGDLATWTNYGTAFTATSSNYTNTNYQRIGNWGQLLFRLQLVP